MNNSSELFSPFLGASYNIPEEEDRVKTYLSDRFTVFADVINDKKIGVISQDSENFNGEKWFFGTTRVTRNGYQTLAYIPSYPNTGSITLIVNSDPAYPLVDVNPEFVVTQVWGSASKPCSSMGAGDGDYFSFFSEGNSKITFTMSDTQIVITTTTDMRAYSGFIVINYIRNGV